MNLLETTRPDVEVFEDMPALCREAAMRFSVWTAVNAVSGRPFSVALAGGSTPQAFFHTLTQPPFDTMAPWQFVHFFFGDERAVGPDSPQSNYHMAREALFQNAPIPRENIHRIEGENPDPEAAAVAYEQEMRRFFGRDAGAFPTFNLVLLGLGPDGHTASLFPGSPVLNETTRWAAAGPAGREPFVPRITLTLPVINHAEHIIFLVAGADKADIVGKIFEPHADPRQYPALAVAPVSGDLVWLLDATAADKY